MRFKVAVALIVCAAVAGGFGCRQLPDDLPSLMKLMGSNDMGVNFDAAKRVDQLFGKDGLLEALKQDDANTRAVAAHFLMNHPEPDVEAALLDATRDADEYVRMWAVFSLGKVGSREAIPRMKDLTADPSEKVSRRAKEALEELNNRFGASTG